MKPAVLITGAAKRLGREIALYLAEQGHDIALHYHASHNEAEATAAEIRARGPRCETFRADLADISALPALVARVLAAFPHCRALVNNAAIFEQGPFMEADEASFDRHMTINCKAPVFLTRAFVAAHELCHPRLERGSCASSVDLEIPAFAGMTLSVVNLIDAKVAEERHSYFYYLLSKKALEDFTRMAAAELGPAVRVSAVYPGIVMPSVDGKFDEAYMQRTAAEQPQGRHLTPREVAEQVGEKIIN